MLRKVLSTALVAAIVGLCLGGCSKKSTQAEPNEQAVKTVEEYRAEAKRDINEDNMAEELEKMEKEVEQELSEEQ
jgi:uncharacterized protein HemX